jgi:hypothetical protein
MVNSLKSIRMGPKVCNHSTPSTISQPAHVNGKHMRFQVVMSNLKKKIFTMPTTFHGPTIGYYDLKIIDSMNITIGFLGNATMNKIVGAITANKDDDLHMLNIANECYHHNNFQIGSKSQKFSEELHRCGSMIVWRIRSHMVAYGQI